ncbi:MAG: hypothetical protein IJ044_06265 [Oscillospiraceae bacterium]|nr:hypothetical protein [Oscillospiraceae bacterium]
MSTKKGTIKTVKPSGYTNKLSSDSWSYPDNQMVIDITGERITYGELKQRRASGYYDDWQSEAEKAAKRKSAAEKRAEAEAAAAAAAKEQARIQAENEAYQEIVREAYRNYRRNLQMFPEYASTLASGSIEDLLTENDLVFQQAVEEEAKERSRKSQNLTRQLEAITAAKRRK